MGFAIPCWIKTGATRTTTLQPKFDLRLISRYHRLAGWSSLVARWAHNPKVGGSNPPPATNGIIGLRALEVSDAGPKRSNKH